MDVDVEVNFSADTPEPRTELKTRERSQSPLQRAESYELALEGSTSKPPIEPGEPHGILKKSQTYEVTAEPLPDGDSEATDNKG